MAARLVVDVVATKEDMLTHFNRIILLLCCMLFASSVVIGQQAKKDTAAYKKMTLKKVTLDLLSSYYQQDGMHSAVTGGEGTEELTNTAANGSLVLVFENRKGNEHTFGLDLGVDSYTSASSDQINPATVTSASYRDIRIYPGIHWNYRNKAKRYTIRANITGSTEYDYTSVGVGLSFSTISKNGDRELGIKLNAFIDKWQAFYPVEIRRQSSVPTENRNSYSASFTFSQVINKRMQMAVMADIVYQTGLLSTPFHRVYFQDQSLPRIERLPDTRLKTPIGLRFNYFVNERFVARTYYRYYRDDWGLTAHTASLELPVKINKFTSVYPFFRYYTQSEAQYFAPLGIHTTDEPFYTSDYDLSTFNSQFYGIGARIAPPKGLMLKNLQSVDLRFGMYNRSDGLQSTIGSIHLQFAIK